MSISDEDSIRAHVKRLEDEKNKLLKQQLDAMKYGHAPAYGTIGQSVHAGGLSPNKVWQNLPNVAEDVDALKVQVEVMRTQVMDFLGWLQWAHPELRDEYNTCCKVAHKIDRANEEMPAQQAQQRQT